MRSRGLPLLVALLALACVPARPAVQPRFVDAYEPGQEGVRWLSPALLSRQREGRASPADTTVMRLVDEGKVLPIGGLAIDSAETHDGVGGRVSAEAAVYVAGDTPVAWHDARTGDVVEASTGYRLNVRDAPGTGLRGGPKGESLYVYGFAYYPRWHRVLPEPAVAVIEAFYAAGIEHVRRGMAAYQTVARPEHSGGDLNLVRWDPELLARMARWGSSLPGAPLFQLPPSGTVDVRSERFSEVLATAKVTVDPAGVAAYLETDSARSKFSTLPPPDEVVRVLTEPFRRPDVYSDMERAIILGAIDADPAPLRLLVDAGVSAGLFVPDTGDKVIHIAPSELNLNFDYNGLIISKLPHEAQHILEFRAHRFLAQSCVPEEDDVIETLNYLMEYMWWVQRFPNDAPYWDWEPINSGLVLARLLSGVFPNSSC